MHRSRIAGPSRAGRDEHRPLAGAPAAEPGGLAGPLQPGSPPVGDHLGRPGAGPADRGLPHCRHLPASLLQPGAQDHQRDGRPGRNRPVDHDRRPSPRRRLLPCHRRGPDRCPGIRPRTAGRGGPGRHRHRRLSRTRQRRDPAAPRLDRARRGHHSRVARLRRPAHRAAAADPDRLRLRRRHRRLRCPARLAAHRDPRRKRPGPGRAADVIRPDLLAVHRRRRPAAHPAPSSRPGSRRERRGEGRTHRAGRARGRGQDW
jgi:hypothetical protein